MAMGLLGYAVAGAGEGLGQGMVSVGFEAMKQAMEQNRQAALLQMREEMDIAKEKRGQDIKIADEKRREETAKRLRETDAGLINQTAQDIASSKGRITTPADVGVEADNAAKAYNTALSQGLITQSDANLGYRAAEQYREENSQPDKNPTLRDTAEARVKLGFDKPTDLMKLDDADSKREMQVAIAQGKVESALQIAQMKGDFGMMLGELKAASAGGNEKATELMRNWKFLEGQGYDKSEIAQKLLEGKVGEYDTETTKRMNDDGSETTTTRKVRHGSQQSSGGAPKLPAGLPAGAKQIGTSAGRPVYQLPNGKRVIQTD